jgi:hypothetical protein
VRKGAKNDGELYRNSWLSKWKSNHADQKQWVEFFCFTFLFSARSNIIIHSMINISVAHAFKAKIDFDEVDNNSYAL